MFKILLEKFIELPSSVQRSFIFVFVAWAAQYFTAYSYILKEELPWPNLVIALMLFMGLIFVKKWGRFICVFFTGWAIVWYVYFVIFFYAAKQFNIVGMLIINILLFATAIYYLMKKETIKYFKERAEEAQAKAEKDAKVYKKMVQERTKRRNSLQKPGAKKRKKK